MKKLLLLVLTIPMTSSILAMEQQQAQPSIYVSGNQALYIGESSARDDLEKIYGKKFPLKTVFVNIGFQNVPAEIAKPLPQFIPAGVICDSEENDSVTLEINGKNVTVLCKQKSAPTAPNETFASAYEYLAKRFFKKPNWTLEGEDSLVKAGVIQKRD